MDSVIILSRPQQLCQRFLLLWIFVGRYLAIDRSHRCGQDCCLVNSADRELFEITPLLIYSWGKLLIRSQASQFAFWDNAADLP